MSGSRQTKQFTPFRGGVTSVLLCAVLSFVHLCTLLLEFRKVSRTRHSLKFHPCQTPFLRSQCLVPDKLNNLHPFGGGGVTSVLLCAVLSLSTYVPFYWNFEKCLEPDTL